MSSGMAEKVTEKVLERASKKFLLWILELCLPHKGAANWKCDVIRVITNKLSLNLFVYILLGNLNCSAVPFGRLTAVSKPAGHTAKNYRISCRGVISVQKILAPNNYMLQGYQRSKWLSLIKNKTQVILRNTSGIFWSAQFAWKPSNQCLFINVTMDM